MSYQQPMRYEPKYEGDNRASPLRELGRVSPYRQDPRYTSKSPYPHQQHYLQQYQQQHYPDRHPYQQQRQYPSDDIANHRTRPIHGEMRQERERYEPKKFDYQYDDRFHRQTNAPARYQEHLSPRHNDDMYQDRSPRHQYDDMRQYDRSPRRNDGMYSDRSPRYHHEEMMHPDRSPRHNEMYDHRGRHDDRGYDVVQPAGRAYNYDTKITDLLTSIRDPEQKDDTLIRTMEANKGYLVMMRFRQSDLSEVINAIQENLSTLGAHNGYVIGFAEPEDMEILISSNQAMATDQWWDPRPSYDGKQRSRYAVCCFWFKDAREAKRWFESAKRIKQPEFPNSNPYQAVIVPMTYGSNKEPLPFGPASNGVTLLWSEYPHIFERNKDDFRKNYSDLAWDCMKAYGAFPNVAVSKYVAGWDSEPQKYGQPQYLRPNYQPQRFARAISTGWIQPNTYIAVSAFPTRRSLLDFYHSPFHQELRYRLDKYSDPVFLAITLSKVNGTSR